MKRIRWIMLPLVAVAGLSLASCSDNPQAPAAPDVHLRLEIDRTLGGSRVALVTAIAWNTSATAASAWNDGCGIRPELQIHDSNGAVVMRQYCPVMAPPYIGELGQEPVSATLSFDGLIFNPERNGLVPAPSGEYTAIATFAFYDSPGAPHELRQEQKFIWIASN